MELMDAKCTITRNITILDQEEPLNEEYTTTIPAFTEGRILGESGYNYIVYFPEFDEVKMVGREHVLTSM
jgi:hypothetical protein